MNSGPVISKEQKCGTIKIIIGCMFSGKTTELIKEKTKWESIGIPVLVINYDEDIRYGDDNFLYSHGHIKTECIKLHELSKLDEKLLDKYKVILINEGQFFSDLKSTVITMCEKYKKHIIVSGLDGDFKRNTFGQITDLIPYADEIIKTKAMCSICTNGTDALFSWRKSHETDQKVIGSNNYIPVCRKHYIELKNNHK